MNQYNLNGEQWQAYVLVTWHAIADRPTLLRLYIGGCGGTGQTQVILALNEFFRQIDHSRQFCVCSYMGVAAKNVSGTTLHSALNLNERKDSRMTTKSIRDLIMKWEGVDFLFVDEVSVIGQKMMVSIH